MLGRESVVPKHSLPRGTSALAGMHGGMWSLAHNEWPVAVTPAVCHTVSLISQLQESWLLSVATCLQIHSAWTTVGPSRAPLCFLS